MFNKLEQARIKLINELNEGKKSGEEQGWISLDKAQKILFEKTKGEPKMTYEYEQELLNEGYKIVCGIDEAGRGPLSGPVCAAAVILPMNCEIEGINDSKKLSEKKREKLFDIIIEKALACSIEFVDAQTIDDINILQATFLAMRTAVENLELAPDVALIDGNQKPKLQIEERTLVKGDAKSISIAAASILAKVSRDRYMLELDAKFPQYGFCKHKGYGTKLHYEMIAEHGITNEHRKTFLKKILGE